MSKSSTPVPFVDEHVSSNGHHADEPILPSGFRRADVVRLLVQCMGGLGYARAAAALEEDAGVPLLSEAVGDFRAGVLAGEWEKAERLIPELGLAPASRDSVRFLIHRQHFLECIEAQQPAVGQAQRRPPESSHGWQHLPSRKIFVPSAGIEKQTDIFS